MEFVSYKNKLYLTLLSNSVIYCQSFSAEQISISNIKLMVVARCYYRWIVKGA